MNKTSTKKQTSRIALICMFSTMLFMLIFSGRTKAQLVYNESFESVPVMTNTTTLSLGWAQGKYGPGVDPDNYWDRRMTGLWPVMLPRTGNGMMRYQSWSTTAGEASFLASKRLDMRAMPAGGTSLSFWMYRDNGWVGYPDRIQVYLNSTPDMAGAPYGPIAEAGTGSTFINRECNLVPVAGTCNAWNQYTYNIPLASGYNTANCYVIIVATSGFGNDIHIDDFSITTWPNAQTFTAASAAVVSQNINTTGPSQLDQQIIGCRFTMSGATSPKALTQMIFNTNGSTSPANDITNAKLWFSGGTNTFSTANALPLGTYTNPVLTNDTFLVANWANYSGLTTFSGLEHGDNYFWITYDIKPGAISGNYVDAEWLDFEISTVAAATTVPTVLTLPGSRLIDLVYCVPSYFVGTSWAGYQTNDFVNSVTIAGDNLPPPGISNNQNWITSAAGPLCPGPFPRLCPFQSHPPDYEAFAEVSGKTTAFTANNTTVYPASLQVGTYGGGNAIAAWIDYNKDGAFNNWFLDITINALAGVAGTNTFTLAGVVTHPGWKVGMTVAGTGIAPGATITGVLGNTVTVSLNNVGAVSGPILFTTTDGEKIAQSQGLGALGTYVTTFKVPITAVSGKTRLRVREVWVSYNIDPCATATYGETEDYTVTIIPDCPGFPGYTTWLGLTSNWADPSNWCPAIAPISPNPFVNVRIPGGPAGPYTYVRPIITAGVLARANKLRVETNDTIYIDATTNSSLTVQDSLKIWTPTSAIKINTTFIDTAQVQNGALNRPVDNPLTNALRSRSFLAFTQADLLGQGLITGDVITNILIHLQRKSNGNPYKNFTCKYYYASSAPFGTGSTAVIPVPLGAPAAPVTIFAGDLDVDAWVPGANAFGTVDLLLSTPIIWSGTANNLIIEMCYDNVGFPGTGVTDEIRFTQTTALRRYLNMEELSTFPKAGCSFTPQDTVFVPCTGTIGVNTVTIVDPAAAAKIYPGQLAVGGGISGLQVISVAGTTITMSGPAFATFGSTMVNFYNVNTIGIVYRPNLTFKFTRPYIKYPILVGGHWENNGLFQPAVSRVTLNGAIANQKVDGASNTTFYDLNIQNANHVMRMTDFTVTDSLRLVSGRLKLNNGLVTLTNQLPSALTYVLNVGDIQAETDVIANNISPYGRISWNMGSTVGLRTIPFINASGVRIPLDYNIDVGSHNVIIGTYSTLADNTNLPAPEVTNILGVNNAVGGGWGTGGWSMVDRYYFIDNTAGVTPQADITFRYGPLEQAQSGNVGMVAQRWIPTTDVWEFPFQPSQVFVAGAPNSVQVPNYTGFDVSSWWTIVGNSTPLPVSLLEFKAVQHHDKVKLFWSTASEINSSHFEIERTVDNDAFEFIGRVESLGSNTNRQEYAIWDNNPVDGTQYYYLRQYDFDGRMESYGPVSAKFSNEVFDIVTTTVSSTDEGLTVVFNYNSTEPYSYRIMDMTGRIVVAKDRNPAVNGLNVIDIDATLAKGAYHIVLQNSSKVVSRKFFY